MTVRDRFFGARATSGYTTVAGLLGRQSGAAVTLIHAVIGAGLGAVSPEIYEDLFARPQERLAEEADRLRRAGATVEEELAPGAPYDVLVNAAHREGARLLVVSSLGQIAGSPFFIGSVAERVAVQLSISAGRGSPAYQLIQLSREAAADLIVVGSHQRHGLERFRLGSASRGVLRHASVSVAVVPKPTAAKELA